MFYRKMWGCAVVACVLLLRPLTAAGAEAAALPAGEIDAARAACRQLVTGYAYHRDRADGQAVGALFTEDAVFELLGDVFRGRAAIRKRVDAGASGPTFRHLMSTIHIEVENRDQARGVSYVTVYSAPGPLPANLAEWMAIGEYHDEFVRTPDGWRIQRRTFVPAFFPPADEGD